MPIAGRIAEMKAEVAAWRRDIHEYPEILFDVHRTAGSVAEKLKAFGCDDVVTGIGRTGVGGVIHGKGTGPRKVIGLRADMDALPMDEQTNLPYRSKNPGKMHACGHDGHTAMLLGGARYLPETPDFSGTGVVIFHPADEGGGGGREMVKDGLMERFGIQEVYGMHNMPGIAPGHFAIRPGPLLAAADRIVIEIEGWGPHAAKPHMGVGPVVVGAQIVNLAQTIVSRSVDPIKSGLISICQFIAGSAYNVIPHTATLRVTSRSLLPELRDTLVNRLREIVEGTAKACGARA